MRQRNRPNGWLSKTNRAAPQSSARKRNAVRVLGPGSRGEAPKGKRSFQSSCRSEKHLP